MPAGAGGLSFALLPGKARAGCDLLQHSANATSELRVFPALPPSGVMIAYGLTALAVILVLAFLLVLRIRSEEHQAGRRTTTLRRASDLSILTLVLAGLGTGILVQQYDVPEAQMVIKMTCLDGGVVISYPQIQLAFVQTPGNQEVRFSDIGVASRAVHSISDTSPYPVPIETPVLLELYRLTSGHPEIVNAAGLVRDRLPIKERTILIRFADEQGRLDLCDGSCDAGGQRYSFVGTGPGEFAAWQVGRRMDLPRQLHDRSFQDLMAIGKRVYPRRCAPCHGSQGAGNPVFPALNSIRLADMPLHNLLEVVSFGARKGSMKAFKDQLTLTELAGVLTYIRNAWDHARGDLIQPSLVGAFLVSNAPPLAGESANSSR